MEYQILKPRGVSSSKGRSHYGTLYYDGDRLKLNLLVGKSVSNQNKIVIGMFYLIADVLEKYYDLVKPVVNHGSISLGSNLSRRDKKPKNYFENNELYQMILKENPDIREAIDKQRKLHLKYKKDWYKRRKYEKKIMSFIDGNKK